MQFCVLINIISYNMNEQTAMLSTATGASKFSHVMNRYCFCFMYTISRFLVLPIYFQSGKKLKAKAVPEDRFLRLTWIILVNINRIHRSGLPLQQISKIENTFLDKYKQQLFLHPFFLLYGYIFISQPNHHLQPKRTKLKLKQNSLFSS